jgi:hypothetical protein
VNDGCSYCSCGTRTNYKDINLLSFHT